MFSGRQIGIRVFMSNLLPWEKGAKGFLNLKNSNPSSLVHDWIVKAEKGNVIVMPHSHSVLSIDFQIWMLMLEFCPTFESLPFFPYFLCSTTSLIAKGIIQADPDAISSS